MYRNLAMKEKITLLRPVNVIRKKDKYNIPIMNKVTESMLDIDNLKAMNIQNLRLNHNNSQHIVFMFREDKYLKRYWEDPLKYIPRLQSAACVTTPDFSVDPKMDDEEYRHEIYKARWLGCFWQDAGICCLPTAMWTTEEKYDLCFSSIPYGSIVVVSTLGAGSNATEFLNGYNELMRRIQPPLVIVYGDMIAGMYGKFINFKYKDCFEKNTMQCEQLKLPFSHSPIFIIRREDDGQSRIVC